LLLLLLCQLNLLLLLLLLLCQQPISHPQPHHPLLSQILPHIKRRTLRQTPNQLQA
jgi:hypothetical protein